MTFINACSLSVVIVSNFKSNLEPKLNIDIMDLKISSYPICVFVLVNTNNEGNFLSLLVRHNTLI